MIEMMRENDAPKDQYERIGFKAPADAKEKLIQPFSFSSIAQVLPKY